MKRLKKKLLICYLRTLRRIVKVALACLLITTHSLAHAKTANIPENTLTEAISINSFIQLNKIQTAEDYAAWLRDNMTYEPDSDRDSWSQPLETMKRGTGDCEDMAFLSAAILKQLGYKPMVLAAGRKEKAHVFTVFLSNNVLHVFDNNTYYINPEVKTLDHIYKVLSKRQNIDYLLEVRVTKENIKQMRILFAKNLPPKSDKS